MSQTECRNASAGVVTNQTETPSPDSLARSVSNLDPTGRKERLFLTTIFTYHLIVTSAAPLSRMIHKIWCALIALLAHYGAGINFELVPACLSQTPGSVASGDRAFGLDAMLAISWMLCGYVQLVCTTRLRQNRRLHKLFGYVSLFVYVLHLGGALSIWATADEEEHSLLNRSMRFNTAFGVTTLVFEGLKKPLMARLNNNDVTMNRSDWSYHRFIMCQAYLYSLNGAGTIRTVAIVQSSLEYLGVVGGDCDWMYTWRILFTLALTLLQRAAYIKLKRNEFDSTFLKEVLELTVFWIIIGGGMILSLTQTQTLILCVMFKVFWVTSELIEKYGGMVWNALISVLPLDNIMESQVSHVLMMVLTDVNKYADATAVDGR